MDAAIPRAALVEVVKPHYFAGRKGRRPIGIERMLRMCFLQLWSNLSDEGVGEAVYGSGAFSEFMGLSFGLGGQVPDATTLLKFRRIVEPRGLAREIPGCVNAILESEGVMMRGGSIVGATIIRAPSSTKNASGERDPEMRQTKKGQQWRFGVKARIGVDAGSGLAHTAEHAAANERDVTAAHRLLRDDGGFCYADSGYTGVAKREEAASGERLSQVERVVAEKPSRIKGRKGLAVEHDVESRKASVRSKVEHPFLIVKRQFGYDKCRYRGIEKNGSAPTVLFALANVEMRSRAGRIGPPASARA